MLKELQLGITPLAVQEALLKEYPVTASVQRIKAYRRYREQRGEYWTVERLERTHWQFLYEQVSLEDRLFVKNAQARKARQQRMATVRAALCERAEVSEELVQVSVLQQFFQRHEDHARLVLQYPQARA